MPPTTQRGGAGRNGASAFEDALSFYDLALQALDLVEPADDARRCAVLSERSPALHSVGRFDDETASAREAVAIARAHRWGDELAVAVMRLGNAARTHVDPMVLEGVTEALALLPKDALARRAQLLSFRGSYAVMTPFGNPDFSQIDALSTEAVDLARRAGDPAATRTH